MPLLIFYFSFVVLFALPSYFFPFLNWGIGIGSWVVGYRADFCKVNNLGIPKLISVRHSILPPRSLMDFLEIQKTYS